MNYPKQTDNYDVDIFNANFRELAGDVISLDTAKFDKAEAQGLFKDVAFNRGNGVITFTLYDGSVKTIDTLLEKLAVNFDFDPQTQRLIITLDDGEVKYIDLSALITQYEFLDSDTVAFTVDGAGKISAKIREGSIGEKHLRPNYLADIKTEAAKAEAGAAAASESKQAAADSEAMAVASAATATQKADAAGESAVAARQKAAEAADSAVAAESFARGGTGTREGEDTDNAAAYYTLSKALIEEAEKLLEQAEKLKYVSTQASQGLTEEEKQNARENIGVPTKTSELTNDSGFGACVHLTQAEYDALPDSKLTDDKLYLITDGGVTNGGSGDGTADVPFSKSFVQWHVGSSSPGFKEYGDFCEILTNNSQSSPRYIFSIAGAANATIYGILSVSADLNQNTIAKLEARWLYRSDDIKPENWFVTGERVENNTSKLKIRVWKKFEKQWEAWSFLPIHISRFSDEYIPLQRNDNGSQTELPTDAILTVSTSEVQNTNHKILWENTETDIYADFGQQTITLNDSLLNYDTIEICYKLSNDSNANEKNMVQSTGSIYLKRILETATSNPGIPMKYVRTGGNQYIFRTAYASKTSPRSLVFSPGFIYTVGGANEIVNNDFIIPLFVTGHKY